MVLDTLRQAVYDKKLDIVNTLAKNNADINKKDVYGDTPLLTAVKSGCIEIAKILLENGCKVNIRDELGWTALHHASYQGDEDLVKLLLSWKARPDRVSFKKYTPVHLAVIGGYTTIICLLKSVGANLECRNFDEQTPLHVAVCNECEDIVWILLKLGSVIDAENGEGNTPLYKAIENLQKPIQDTSKAPHIQSNRLKIINMFLHNDANPNIPYISDFDRAQIDSKKMTCLMLASKLGLKDLVLSLLAKGSWINVRDSKNRSALYVACENGHAEIVDVLLAAGAERTIRVLDDVYVTPLHVAAAYGFADVISVLTRDMNKTEIEMRNNSLSTPLMLAVKRRQIKSVVQLLAVNADIHAVHRTISPLGLAIREKDSYMVAALYTGTKTEPSELLIEAVRKCNIEIVSALVQCEEKLDVSHLMYSIQTKNEEIILYLLQNGCNLKVTSGWHYSPLHLAIEFGLVKIVRALLEAGADVNTQTTFFVLPTAIHMATMLQDIEMVEILLEYGTNLEVINIKRDTPLSMAIQENNMKITELLLQAGANPYHKNNDKMTCLDIARRNDNDSMVQLLNDYIERIERSKKSTIISKDQVLSYMKDKSLQVNIKSNLIQNAAENENVELIEYMIENGFDVNQTDENGKTALHFASELGNLEIVKKLLEAGANPNVISKDEIYPTALHLSVAKFKDDVVRELIKYEANLEIVNTFGESPVFSAIKSMNFLSLIILLHANCNYLLENNEGSPLLHEAMILKDTQSVKYLLIASEKKIDDLYNGIEETDKSKLKEGVEDFKIWYGNYHDREIKMLHASFSINSNRKRFCDNIADCQNSRTSLTALHVIVDHDYPSFLELFACLERHMVNLNKLCYKQKETALYRAIRLGRIRAAETLIKHGACVNSGSLTENQTCLLLAIERGYKSIIHYLVHAGAKVPKKWKPRMYPLSHIARLVIRSFPRRKGLYTALVTMKPRLPTRLIDYIMLEDNEDLFELTSDELQNNISYMT